MENLYPVTGLRPVDESDARGSAPANLAFTLSGNRLADLTLSVASGRSLEESAMLISVIAATEISVDTGRFWPYTVPENVVGADDLQ